MNHQNWSIFNGGTNLGGNNFGGTNLGGYKFWTSQKFRQAFPTIIIFLIFWTGGKNSLDYLEKKYGNIG